MEVKRANQTDWPKIEKFLKDELRDNVDWGLSEEYPSAFSQKNRNNIHFIEHDNQIVSHAVLQKSFVRTHYHLFKVALIGSVVTQPESQRQGYSQKIIETCIESAKKQGCDLSVLWSDLYQFYNRFGFEMAGSEVALQMSSDFNPPTRDDLRIVEGPKVSAQAIQRLYDKHNLRTIRSATDIAKFLKIPNSEIFTAWNQQTGQLEAYAALGKGVDFFNYIHEWGGSVSGLLTLAQFITQKKKQDITLITPPQSKNLIRQFTTSGAKSYPGVLGMIRIINPQSFCQKIRKGAMALGYRQFRFDFKDGVYTFGVGKDIYQTSNPGDVVRLCFGPLKPQQIFKFNSETSDILNQIFPIAFWVWGWDSI